MNLLLYPADFEDDDFNDEDDHGGLRELCYSLLKEIADNAGISGYVAKKPREVSKGKLHMTERIQFEFEEGTLDSIKKRLMQLSTQQRKKLMEIANSYLDTVKEEEGNVLKERSFSMPTRELVDKLERDSQDALSRVTFLSSAMIAIRLEKILKEIEEE